MNNQEFTDIFRQLLPKVSRYLAYRVNANDVEDLASKIFEIAWQKRQSCPEGKELPWLYKIAGFVVSNHRRKVTAISLALFDTDATAPSAEDLVIADLSIKRAWSALTAKDRSILALAAFEQLTVAEISVAMGISPNAASIRLHRARKNFDELLKESESE
jgi:RNA polymerase sigma-70 factor (ECF subfamily)